MEPLVSLRQPQLSELWYRKHLLSDPETMRYNRGYDLGFSGYHNETGCIDFPESDWEAWFNWFCQSEPQRFYAYIVRCSDGVFLGEVNLHHGDAVWLTPEADKIHRFDREGLRLA